MNFANLMLVILLLVFAMLIAFLAGMLAMAWVIKHERPDLYNVWINNRKKGTHATD